MKEMSFCVRDVMNRPLFGRAKVIAGQNGRYREVRWVHILEITNAAPYVSKNDLILTTGLWLKRSVKSGMAFMRQIIDHETAGLCIEFGTTVDEIPQPIIDLCDRRDFPLILFRQPVRFEEITQDIHSFLINRHFGLMKNLERFSRTQQQLILRSTDIPALLRLLQRYTGERVVYLSQIKPNRFYPDVDREEKETINRFCVEKLKHIDRVDEASVWKMADGRRMMIQPVVCFGQVFSYIGLLFHQPRPDEYMTLLIDYTAKAVATVLLRTQFLEERIQRSQNELIQDLLSGRIDSEGQARTRMGLPPVHEAHYRFVAGVIVFAHDVLRAGAERMETMNQDLSVLTRSLLGRSDVHHLMMMKNNQIYLLCALRQQSSGSAVYLRKTLQSLIDGLRRFVGETLQGLDFRVGFGHADSRILPMRESFKQAFQVIDVATAVPTMKDCCFYEQIGVYQLLQAVPRSVLRTFVTDQIGPLLAADRRHHLNLVHTLTVYLRAMGSKEKTARQLFIHRQTLYNRLEKISDIMGEDYVTPRRRYCLEMALLGNRLLNEKETE
ncbi:MAG: PucR family transcriptional regulator [Sporolactobacillus sp.]|jgi:purine catabolism regulator|nr:PucR family transcriptional regulator [Sporolactobacillus sp.]